MRGLMGGVSTGSRLGLKPRDGNMNTTSKERRIHERVGGVLIPHLETRLESGVMGNRRQMERGKEIIIIKIVRWPRVSSLNANKPERRVPYVPYK